MEKEGYIDLHTHTTASDGSMSPLQLVKHAFDKGLSAVAVTDHDTVSGVEQALQEGKRLGIEVVPGVEISVDFCRSCIITGTAMYGNELHNASEQPAAEMHLLGYFFNGGHNSMRKILEELREKRDQRNPRIISKLNELGFDITVSQVNSLAAGEVVGRPHIARAMQDKGYVSSIEEAFEKYLASGRPAYFKKNKMSPQQGIGEIAKAGGIPVLAHPIYLYLSTGQMDNLIARLTGIGLKGIEAYYTENTKEQTEELLQLAQKHKLMITGGSDFHGSYKPGIEIGSGRGNLKIKYHLLERLKQVSLSLEANNS